MAALIQWQWYEVTFQVTNALGTQQHKVAYVEAQSFDCAVIVVKQRYKHVVNDILVGSAHVQQVRVLDDVLVIPKGQET